jgi:hypothetical protein
MNSEEIESVNVVPQQIIRKLPLPPKNLPSQNKSMIDYVNENKFIVCVAIIILICVIFLLYWIRPVSIIAQTQETAPLMTKAKAKVKEKSKETAEPDAERKQLQSMLDQCVESNSKASEEKKSE